MGNKIKLTSVDIKNIVNECINRLNEGISSIIYHYTHPLSLLEIIKSDKINISDDIEMPDGSISKGGLSVTRQRSDKIGYAVAFRHEYFDGCYVRLQLDGELLSYRYSGEAVDEFGNRGDMHIDDWNGFNRMPFYTQAEDRIYTRNNEPIKDAFKYIKRIDIMFPTYDKRYDSYIYEIEEFLRELVKITLNTGWERKIYLYFDDEFNSDRIDFNFQTDRALKIKDIAKGMMNESKVGENYDILYRGVNAKQSINKDGIWLTTSKEYASLYGKVSEHIIT